MGGWGWPQPNLHSNNTPAACSCSPPTNQPTNLTALVLGAYTHPWDPPSLPSRPNPLTVFTSGPRFLSLTVRLALVNRLRSLPNISLHPAIHTYW